MPQNLLSQKNSIIGVVVLLVALGGGYFLFNSSQSASSDVSSGKVNPKLFSSDMAAFYVVKDKINLGAKDLAFMKKAFYANLEDNTVDIQSVEPTGRPNPFWAP